MEHPRDHLRHRHGTLGSEVEPVVVGVARTHRHVPVDHRHVLVGCGLGAHDLVRGGVVVAHLMDRQPVHARHGCQGVHHRLDPRLIDRCAPCVVRAELHEHGVERGAVRCQHRRPVAGVAVHVRVDGDVPVGQRDLHLPEGSLQHAVADHQQPRLRGPRGRRTRRRNLCGRLRNHRRAEQHAETHGRKGDEGYQEPAVEARAAGEDGGQGLNDRTPRDPSHSRAPYVEKRWPVMGGTGDPRLREKRTGSAHSRSTGRKGRVAVSSTIGGHARSRAD